MSMSKTGAMTSALLRSCSSSARCLPAAVAAAATPCSLCSSSSPCSSSFSSCSSSSSPAASSSPSSSSSLSLRRPFAGPGAAGKGPLVSASRRASAFLAGSHGSVRSASTVRIDGVPHAPSEANLSLQDLTFIRGDGAFDVVPLLPSPSQPSLGLPYGMELHLDRFVATARHLRLPLAASRRQLEAWCREMGRENGPGALRIVATRGQPAQQLPGKLIMMHEVPMALPESVNLKSMDAPWHFGYAGKLPAADSLKSYNDKVDVDHWNTIKWMSYAPNCLMTRIAQEHGKDDALLLSEDGRVLDGPNFAIGFVLNGGLRFVDPVGNRLLPSCTQVKVMRAARSVGFPVSEEVIPFEEALKAGAAFVMGARRHVLPVASIDDKQFSTQNAMLCDLQSAYWRMVEEDLEALEQSLQF